MLKSSVRCDFQITEQNDKFTKFRLKNTNDGLLTGLLTDDVNKSVREIRSSLIKKKNELKQKGSQAWIPPVVPPVLCYIDEFGVKKKLDWFKL